jgi:general secretion pathway protein L
MTIAANSPLKDARSRAWGRRALGWWLGELRGCRDDLRRVVATRGRHCVTIEAGERYWLLRQGQRPIGQVDVRTGDAVQLLRLIPPAGLRRPIIVEIPPERALAKTVALPAGAKGQLDRILGFEIARHFPFPAERVYFQHRIVTGDGDGGVMVEIVAVPREIVDSACAVLGEAGLRPAAIAVSADPADKPGAKPLFLATAALGLAPRRAAPTIRVLGFAAALSAAAALASWPLAQQAALGSLDRELAALKPHAEAALRAGETARREGERSAAILALTDDRPPLVAALDRLSRDLPDGAWLLSLSITGRDVVLDGLAPSAATIALALEKSQDFSGIVFRSPIIREASGLEHFQLGATLGAGKP